MTMQAAFIGAEDVLEKQLDSSVKELQASEGMAKCSAHDAMVRNAILQTQTLQIGVSYLRSPLVKIIVAMGMLGSGSAVLLGASRLMQYIATGQLHE